MKHLFKRAAALCTALALSCSLTACGEENPPLQVQQNPAAEPVYLSFFSPKSLSGSDVGKYWSDRFAESYGKPVYVNYEGASYYADKGLSYRELLEKRLQSSQPDDLFIINAEDVLAFEKKGYWLDLSGMDFVDNLSDAALYQSTYQGKVFSVPLCFTGFGLCWNMDMLKARGLELPQNLQEFLAVCAKLKADGILPYGANKGSALTVPAMCSGLAPLYQQNGLQKRIADLNSGAVPISTYMQRGFAFVDQLVDLGYLDPQQALNTIPGEERDLFFNGACAFFCVGLSDAPKNAADIGFEVKMTGLPVLPDGSIAVYGADLRLCVNPDAAQLQTALEFIEMVGAPEALDQSAALVQAMSSAKDSKLTAHSSEQEFWQLLRSPGQIPNQDFALHFNTWENIRNVCREICSGLSVEDACAKLDALQRAELAEYAGAD